MTTRNVPLSFAGKSAFFLLLLAASIAFFATTWDNPFWNPGDFLYLDHAISIAANQETIFTSQPSEPFQPLVRLLFFMEYSLFGLDAWKYYLFNVLIHSLNAFIVFLLVRALLGDRTIAIVSAMLFAFAVGNYGKAVMVVSGVGDLLITNLTLLTLVSYIKNALDNKGKILSWWFLASAGCMILSLLTKTTSFGVIGCMLAFNVFFRAETQARVFNRQFIIIVSLAIGVMIAMPLLGFRVAAQQGLVNSPLLFLKNYASYLVRMVFPIHTSSLVDHAGPLVYYIYKFADSIRLFVLITIVSFSLFGFIFGNRALRFFIAWTYILITPFCFLEFPRYTEDWLDIRHLYLVSVGFSMILASIVVLASRLLQTQRWKRWLPYSTLLFFVLLSQFIVYQLDGKYELIAELPAIQELGDNVRGRHAAMD